MTKQNKSTDGAKGVFIIFLIAMLFGSIDFLSNHPSPTGISEPAFPHEQQTKEMCWVYYYIYEDNSYLKRTICEERFK